MLANITATVLVALSLVVMTFLTVAFVADVFNTFAEP